MIATQDTSFLNQMRCKHRALGSESKMTDNFDATAAVQQSIARSISTFSSWNIARHVEQHWFNGFWCSFSYKYGPTKVSERKWLIWDRNVYTRQSVAVTFQNLIRFLAYNPTRARITIFHTSSFLSLHEIFRLFIQDLSRLHLNEPIHTGCEVMCIIFAEHKTTVAQKFLARFWYRKCTRKILTTGKPGFGNMWTMFSI